MYDALVVAGAGAPKRICITMYSTFHFKDAKILHQTIARDVSALSQQVRHDPVLSDVCWL